MCVSFYLKCSSLKTWWNHELQNTHILQKFQTGDFSLSLCFRIYMYITVTVNISYVAKMFQNV